MSEAFNYLSRRTVIPLHSHKTVPVCFQTLHGNKLSIPQGLPQCTSNATELPNPRHIQGDVYLIFPKVSENFMFFMIGDLAKFKTALGTYKPTTAYDVTRILEEINAAKQKAFETGSKVELVDVVCTQIAFSKAGLVALGVKENTKDPRFDKGPMTLDKNALGDQGRWDDVFNEGKVHGVIMLATSSSKRCEEESKKMKQRFQHCIAIVDEKVGHVLPNGAEHFGYRDGISQPALRGLSRPYPGQTQVDPGVIIMGYKGDPVLDNPSISPGNKRPSWTKGGSIMVVRKLEQDVPAFQQYLRKNGPRWREFAPADQNLTDEEGSELFGARIVGRWKSGAPLALAHYRDDPAIANDPQRNNNFDYSVPGSSKPSDAFCPFTSHIRKTAPRNLSPYIDKKFLESTSIIRSGIPYGPQINSETKNEPRGLLFVCYQSSLDQGFFLQTTGFANNYYFPTVGPIPTKHGPDPILGAPEKTFTIKEQVDIDASGPVTLQIKNQKGNPFELSGFAEAGNPDTHRTEQEFFVTSRGGEYFFVPSVLTLRCWASDHHSSALDLMLLHNVESIQDPYLQALEDDMSYITDTLTSRGDYAEEDFRVGILKFCSGSPCDNSPIAQLYDFTSDITIVKKNIHDSRASRDSHAALTEVLNAKWREDAIKIAVLIVNSPSNSKNSHKCKFASGDPGEKELLEVARKMAALGITLYVLMGCELTSDPEYSLYTGLANATHGALIPSADPKGHAQLIINHVTEQIKLEQILVQYQREITDEFFVKSKLASEVAKMLHAKLNEDKVYMHMYDSEAMSSSESTRNGSVWCIVDNHAEGNREMASIGGYYLDRDAIQNEIQQMEPKSLPISLRQVERIVNQYISRNTHLYHYV